jgi:hypothetical protein
LATAVDPVLAYLVDDLAALGGFGLAVEMTVVVGSLVVIGTPIAESEYFTRLGERFLQTVEHAMDGLRFHRGTEAAWELEQGWREDQVSDLARAREQGYRLFGENAQQDVRERVQGRPRWLRGYLWDERAVQALRTQLAELLGEDATPHRRFLHLRNVSILTGETVVDTPPFLRVRLSDVAAWNIGRPEPSDG